MTNDTIVAISTAYGLGAISIVRVSGEEALRIAQTLTKKPTFTPRYATLSSLYTESGDFLDKAIVIYFKNPHSFTGEDMVEFQLHGGLVVSELVLEEILRLGARAAKPGEFSKRAVLSGKMDVSQAEAIAKLIEANSKDAHKILTRQLKGVMGEFVERTREVLVDAIAAAEVMIDYAEEDLPSDLINSINNKLLSVKSELKEALEGSKRNKGLISGFKLSIIGKPNVGKSSLLNRLLMYERAIVSEIEGTTRDTIEESVRIGTHLLKIVDTAGIRSGADVIEKIGIERSLRSMEESDVVLALFDGSAMLDSKDEEILALLQNLQDKDIIVAINKCDLEQRIDTASLPYQCVHISSKGDISALLKQIESILNQKESHGEVFLSTSRQIDAIQQALASIQRGEEFLESESLELFSYEIHQAILHISSITKVFAGEEILDKMFGEFCLGK